MVVHFHGRNEEYQEDLWRRSFQFLEEHLSTEIVRKYCPPQEDQLTEVETNDPNDHQEKEDKHGAQLSFEEESLNEATNVDV